MEIGRKLIAAVVVLSALAIPGTVVAGSSRSEVRLHPLVNPNWICAFDGRVARIHFQNTSLYPVTITLWHPDSMSPWGSWTFQGGDGYWLERNGPVSFGNDWGFQIGDSPVKCVGKISDWTGGAFWITTDSYNNRG